jgi:tetratricopeptide (TPR) repeat protein
VPAPTHHPEAAVPRPSFLWRFGVALRRHPYRSGALAVVLLLGGSALALHLLATHRFAEAQAALKIGQPGEARARLRLCLRVWPRSVASHLLAARIERADSNYPEAERFLKEATRLQGGPSDATQLEWVLLRAQGGGLEEVESGLWNCVQNDHPETTEVLATLARSYMGNWQYQMAHLCLDLWLERQADAAQAYYWRGWIRERLNKLEKALEDYRKAVELDPDRWLARRRLVHLAVTLNKTPEARTHLDVLLHDHAEDIEVQLANVLVTDQEGETEEAIRLLDALIAAQPEYLSALTLRARLERNRGRARESEKWARLALKQRASDLEALYQLGRALNQQPGRQKEAAEVDARHEKLAETWQHLHELLNGRAARFRHDANVLSQVGVLLLEVGEDDAGVRWLERALAENPHHRETHEALAGYYERRQQPDRAAYHRTALAALPAPPSPNK